MAKAWSNRIPGCFGNADGLFANHPMDAKRALELLAYLYEKQIGWKEFREELVAYMDAQKFRADLKQSQLAKVRSRFKPWLND